MMGSMLNFSFPLKETQGFVLVLLTLIPSQVYTETFQVFCFHFPPEWEKNGTPNNATVHLNHCQDRQSIQINKAQFTRPKFRGDECGNTCCEKNQDDCKMDLGTGYPKLYQTIKDNCEGYNGCIINVSARDSDKQCGKFARCKTRSGQKLNTTKSCFARRIKIFYSCLPALQLTGEVTTPVKQLAMPVTMNPGVIVGVLLATVVLVIVVITVAALILNKRKHRTQLDLPPRKPKSCEHKYENVAHSQPDSLSLPVVREGMTEEGTVGPPGQQYYNLNQAVGDTTGLQEQNYYTLPDPGQAQQTGREALVENCSLEKDGHHDEYDTIQNCYEQLDRSTMEAKQHQNKHQYCTVK